MRYRERGYWEDCSLDAVLTELFDRHAERTAVLHSNEVITYRQLSVRRAALAVHLYDMGLRPLDRAIIHLPNRPEFLYLYLALQRIGVIPVLALWAHRRLEIDHFIRLAEAVAYFGTDPALGREVQQSNPSLQHVVMVETFRSPHSARSRRRHSSSASWRIGRADCPGGSGLGRLFAWPACTGRGAPPWVECFTSTPGRQPDPLIRLLNRTCPRVKAFS